MKYYYFFLLFASAILLIACNSNSLRREDAKAQIAKYYETNSKELLGSIPFEAVIRGKDSGYNNILFRRYINADLLRLKEIKSKENSDSIYIFEITEKGKPYLIKEVLNKEGYPIFDVKMFEYYVSDITEIIYSPDKKEAGALFDLAIENITPFGKNVADLNFKRHLIAFFQLDNNKWKFQRKVTNPSKL